MNICVCIKSNRVEGNRWNYIAIIAIEIFKASIDLTVLII